MNKIVRRICVQLLLVVLALSIFKAGSIWARRGAGDVPVSTAVPLVVYEALVRHYRQETSGLRAMLAARSEVTPREVQIVEVPVPVPDTVYQFVNINSRGVATLGRLSALEVTPQRGIEATGEILKGLDLSGCDDGITITPSSVVCDRPRFGHLYFTGWVFGTVDPFSPTPSPGFLGIAGLEWEPLYRSQWSGIIGVSTDGLFRMGLKKRVELW
jgi:hypothetical protein